MIPAASPCLGEQERAAVDRVLRSGMVAQGPEVRAFEAEFAELLVGGRECVALNSGTSAQHLSLLALGIGPGDEVIVPSFTFAATANTVALTGATPVFVDIDPRTFCVDPAAVEAAITERTRAIMPVHLYGQAASMTRLCALADEHGLSLVEDAAQAHLAEWAGQQVGTFGDAAMFSLYPTKNMTSIEGGMASCATPETARALRLLRNQGMEAQYENEVIGFNNRMTDVHAAVGRVQLTKLPHWTAQRRSNAAFFDANLEGVVTPVVAPEATHVYHQYTLRIPSDRDGFRKALAEEHGVGSGVYYPIPSHRLPSFGQVLELPETEAAAREVLSIPVHPALMPRDLETIVTAVSLLAKAGSA